MRFAGKSCVHFFLVDVLSAHHYTTFQNCNPFVRGVGVLIPIAQHYRYLGSNKISILVRNTGDFGTVRSVLIVSS